MNNPALNEAALLDLASDPRLIPMLLDRARKTVEETPKDPALKNFLPAFKQARDALAPTTRYFVPDTGAELLPDRAGLMAGVDEAERAVVGALSTQG